MHCDPNTVSQPTQCTVLCGGWDRPWSAGVVHGLAKSVNPPLYGKNKLLLNEYYAFLCILEHIFLFF